MRRIHILPMLGTQFMYHQDQLQLSCQEKLVLVYREQRLKYIHWSSLFSRVERGRNLFKCDDLAHKDEEFENMKVPCIQHAGTC